MSTFLLRQSDSTYVVFDATTRVVPSHAVAISEHPIESGSVVADHAQRLPDTFAVTGVVSASPTPTAWNATSRTREQDVRDWLEASVGELVTLWSSRLGTFADYMLRRWTDPLDNVRRTIFDVELVKVVIAEATATTINAAAEAVAAGFTASADVGEQATGSTAAAPETAAADQSILYGLMYGD